MAYKRQASMKDQLTREYHFSFTDTFPQGSDNRFLSTVCFVYFYIWPEVLLKLDLSNGYKTWGHVICIPTYVSGCLINTLMKWNNVSFSCTLLEYYIERCPIFWNQLLASLQITFQRWCIRSIVGTQIEKFILPGEAV